MVNFNNFFHSTTGKYLFSIILGLGLASLFRTVCKGKNCYIFKAPPLEELETNIYRYDKKCYKFTPSATKCDSKKRTLNFETEDIKIDKLI